MGIYYLYLSKIMGVTFYDSLFTKIVNVIINALIWISIPLFEYIK